MGAWPWVYICLLHLKNFCVFPPIPPVSFAKCHFQYFCLNKRIYEGGIDRSIINKGQGVSSVKMWAIENFSLEGYKHELYSVQSASS